MTEYDKGWTHHLFEWHIECREDQHRSPPATPIERSLLTYGSRRIPQHVSPQLCGNTRRFCRDTAGNSHLSGPIGTTADLWISSRSCCVCSRGKPSHRQTTAPFHPFSPHETHLRLQALLVRLWWEVRAIIRRPRPLLLPPSLRQRPNHLRLHLRHLSMRLMERIQRPTKWADGHVQQRSLILPLNL